jgi:hypothetical protein
MIAALLVWRSRRQAVDLPDVGAAEGVQQDSLDLGALARQVLEVEEHPAAGTAAQDRATQPQVLRHCA